MSKVFTKHMWLSVLAGFSQIMLQQSALTGLFFIVGIACNSWLMLFGALLGNVSAVFGALLLRSNRAMIAAGSYGFNGALIGIAVLFYLAPSPASVALIIFASMTSSFGLRLLLAWGKLPAYTAPFILTTWVILLLADFVGLAPNLGGDAALQIGALVGIARGIGQVLFQDYWLSGAIFLAGLFACSPQAALWCVVGSAIGLILASVLGYPEDLIAAGLFGFNAVLAGIALASKFKNSIVRPLVGILLSVLLTRVFFMFSIPPLTAPFVIATWLVILASSIARTRDVEV